MCCFFVLWGSVSGVSSCCGLVDRCLFVYWPIRILSSYASHGLHLVLHYKLCAAHYVGQILLCILYYAIYGMNHEILAKQAPCVSMLVSVM